MRPSCAPGSAAAAASSSNAHDLGVIAKAPLDEVIRCEECNRILVRTAESGI